MARLARVRAALGTLAAGASVLLPGIADACSVCVGPGSEGRGLTAGFYWSALLLTALPFAIAGIVGAWVVRTARRDPKESGRGATEPSPPLGERAGGSGPGT